MRFYAFWDKCRYKLVKKGLPGYLRLILLTLACISLPGGIILAAVLSTSLTNTSDIDVGAFCPNQNANINLIPYTPINRNTTQAQKLLLAQNLGWIVASEPCSHCGGYFLEPFIPGTAANLPPITSTQTTITANQGLGQFNNGVSTLSGNVVITQPGRIVTADQGKLYEANGTYTDVNLIGHVTLHEQGKFLVAESGHINLQNKNTELYNVIYRFFLPRQNQANPPVVGMSLSNIVKSLNAWGSASKVSQGTNKIIQLENTTLFNLPTYQSLLGYRKSLNRFKSCHRSRHCIRCDIIYSRCASFICTLF